MGKQSKPDRKAFQIRIPTEHHAQLDKLSKDGEIDDMNSLICWLIKRYLEDKKVGLYEKQVKIAEDDRGFDERTKHAAFLLDIPE